MIDIDVSKIISEIGEPKARLVENVEEKKQRMIIIICSFVFLFLFIIGLIVFLVLSNGALAAQKDLSSQVETLKQDNQKLIEYDSKAESIALRNRSLNTIIDNQAIWSYVFDGLEERVPKGISFSRFEAAPNEMRLTGRSPDYATLSKLVVSMNESGIFQNVNLQNASLSTVADKQVVDFSINFGFAKRIDRKAHVPDSGSTGQVIIKDEVNNEVPVVPEEEDEGSAGDLTEEEIKKIKEGDMPVL